MTNPNVERRRNERKGKASEFMLNLLDSREQIRDTLEQSERTTHTLSYQGIQVSQLEPTSTLADFIPPYATSTAEVATEIIKQNGDTTIEKLVIRPEDSPEITLRNQGIFAEITCGDQAYAEDPSVLRDGLEVLIPREYRSLRPTLDQLVYYAREKSPQSVEELTWEAEDDDATLHRLTVRSAETAHDSIEELEILKLYRHPSGMRVGTRLHMIESLDRRTKQTNPDHIDQRLVIDVVRGESVHDLISMEALLAITDPEQTKSVEVSIATQRHMDDILETLELVKQG